MPSRHRVRILSPRRAVALALVLAALLVLAVPAWAAAAEYTVNTTEDAANKELSAACATVAGKCSLRAAIEAANFSAVGIDTIQFDPTVFKGEAGDEITPATNDPLPTIVAPVVIDGSGCNPGATVPFETTAPCINGDNLGRHAGLTVEADETTIEHLSIRGAEEFTGIKVVGTGDAKPGARILDNAISVESFAPATAIEVDGTIAGTGNLFEGNAILVFYGNEGSTYGMTIKNGPNRIYGNAVRSEGSIRSGILLEGPTATGNKIGGDTPESENLIFGFRAYGIKMEGTSGNEVGRNHGENGGQFIDGPGVPPMIVSAGQNRVKGISEPGARIRIFSKEFGNECTCEISGFLGEGVADGAGRWEVKIERSGAGRFVVATQTLTNGGTSDLSIATALAEEAEEGGEEVGAPGGGGPGGGEPGGGGGGGGGDSGNGNGGGGSNSGPSTGLPPASAASPAPTIAPPPLTAPKVKIVKGPKKSSTGTTAKFTFKTEPSAGAKFQCKLDKSKWASCKSPKTYKKLKPGKHTFQARAVASGLTGPVTKYQFTVEG